MKQGKKVFFITIKCYFMLKNIFLEHNICMIINNSLPLHRFSKAESIDFQD